MRWSSLGKKIITKKLIMKSYYSLIGTILIGIINFAFASSSNFTLECYAPGTVLADAHIYIGSDNKIYLGNVSQLTNGVILNNGSLELESGKLMGIGKNYLSLSADSPSFEVLNDFTVQNGTLKLYDQDFHAVPSGKEGVYVLGSINAAAGRSDVIPIQIKAIGSDGASIKDYKGESAGSTSISLLGSQTFDASSASSVLAHSTSGGGISKQSSKNHAGIVAFHRHHLISLIVALII